MGIKYLLEAIKNYGKLKEENQRLIEELNFKPDIMSAEYWNNKWQQSIIFYSAPKKKKVTEYLAYREIPEIKEIALKLREENDFDNPDLIPLKVMEWNKAKKFRYANELKEYWDTPEEALIAKSVDCDDVAILEYYLIREILMQLGSWDKNKHRLKCIVGNVNNRGIPSPVGGHFYLNWLASDGEWYVCESIYLLEKAILDYLNLPQKLNPIYGTIWFTFNSENSWAQNSLSITKEDFKKYKR